MLFKRAVGRVSSDQVAGLRRAYLEVTARNEPAIRLYRQIGFRATRTIYKPIPLIPSDAMVAS